MEKIFSRCGHRHGGRSDRAGGETMSFIQIDPRRSSGEDSPSAASHQPSASQFRRLPPWFKVKLQTGPDYQDIRRTMDRLKLHTICEEARCPNVWLECAHGHLSDPRRHLHQALSLLLGRHRQATCSGSRGTITCGGSDSSAQPETRRDYVGEPR